MLTMKTDVELDKEEVKEAIAFYLHQRHNLHADPENMDIHIRSGFPNSNDPREQSGSSFEGITCKDVKRK
jgi:hypothetical protein